MTMPSFALRRCIAKQTQTQQPHPPDHRYNQQHQYQQNQHHHCRPNEQPHQQYDHRHQNQQQQPQHCATFRRQPHIFHLRSPSMLLIVLCISIAMLSAVSRASDIGSSSIASSCQTVCACKWKGGKQTVECIDRALITIPPGIDANTQVLDMSGNNLQILPPDTFVRAGLVNLQRLHLRNCRLGQIDPNALRGLTNLIELDLSHNLLTAVPARAVLAHVASLRELTLASNPIQKVDAMAFAATHSLTKLDLSHCDIATIAPDAFHDLDALHALKLNGNRLAELRPRTIETLSRLHGVELHDNPWLCDCRLRAAKIWLTARNVPYPVAPVCAGGPERVADRTFAELQVEDFACRPEMQPVPRLVEAMRGENASIVCRAAAVPAAVVSWYWNGRLLVNGSSGAAAAAAQMGGLNGGGGSPPYQQVWVFEEGEFEKRSVLVLTNAQDMDSGEFYCVAENRAGATEANFTLHVAVRAAGMAALGNRQIVGITATLALLVLIAMVCMAVVLVRYRRMPYAESKTPAVGRHSAGGGVGGAAGAGSVSPTTATANTTAGQHSQMNGKPSGPPDDHHHRSGSGMEHHITASGVTQQQQQATNPLQKPPRLNDQHYGGAFVPQLIQQTSTLGSMGSLNSTMTVRPALMYVVSPTGSTNGTGTDNNPDLISSSLSAAAAQRNAVDELTQLQRVDAMLTAMSEPPIQPQQQNQPQRPGSGAYSRAGGCDSLYPSGLWPTAATTPSKTITPATTTTSLALSSSSATTATTTTAAAENPVEAAMRRTNSSDAMMIEEYRSWTKKAPYQSASRFPDDESGSIEYVYRTFPRLVAGNGGATRESGYPPDYGLPLVPGAEHQNRLHHLMRCPVPGLQAPAVPINAKNLRVWQRGAVPVLPPVTALKRALTSSRNSPDEGYQEGCGTDV